ncbi:MAG: AAA family ATPase [Verrucomicrobiota bacterium]
MPTELDHPPSDSVGQPSTASILVTGDVVRDIFVYQGDREFPAQPGKIAPHFSDRPGGAKGLYELIAEVQRSATVWGLEDPSSLDVLQPVHALWIACEGGTKKDHEDAAKDAKPAKVWRVSQSLGYALGISRSGVLSRSAAAAERHAVLVIDDAGLAFRALPAKSSWPIGVLLEEPQPDWIIHKMANPIAQGDLWRALIGGPNPSCRNNLIVIVSADELRRAGAAISRGFSWERTLTELCAELNHNPIFQPLLRFPHRLIVNFGSVGAIWFGDSCKAEQPDAPAQQRATLVYDPTLPEGGWKTRLADDRATYGHLNCFTAAIALAAAQAPRLTPSDLNAAIRRGLAASRQLRLLGHGPVSAAKPGPPLAELAKLLDPMPANSAIVEATLKRLAPQDFQIVAGPCGSIGAAHAATWTLAALAENPADQPNLPLYGLAHRVALYGLSSLHQIPHAHFGAMLSVDHQEIETLRSLTQLIQRYEREKQPKQPLSIAAFGPPGAGKSFGIEQIARQILGEEVPILTFNLSQFDTPQALFGAFHQVRDKAIKGLTPIVFWDEFDARDYMWLQYLLAPMQDGSFQENGHTHAIGKCIFVFAGATSWDFERFGPAPMPEGWQTAYLPSESGPVADAPAGPRPAPGSPSAQLVEFYQRNPKRVDADRAANAEFRGKKGPDFLSRLDAHIDVLGPNQRMHYDWTSRIWATPDLHDITFPVRRAIILRQFLGAKKPKDNLPIDRDLLRAFLHVPRYCYGVRSMEKITKHLAVSRTPFRRAHLPPPQVLAQHLDSVEVFDRIYQETQRLLTPQAIDALANAINEGYNHDNPGAWNKAFKALDDAFLQQSNRAAALRIPHILDLVGLRLVPRHSPEPKVDLNDPLAINTILAGAHTAEEQPVFNHIEKHVELLAEEEHRLWVEFHEENGWTYGFKIRPDDPDRPIVPFEKDKANLKHPCLKPFHEMPDDHDQRKVWQNYDRSAILRYPRIMRLTDFKIAFTNP